MPFHVTARDGIEGRPDIDAVMDAVPADLYWHYAYVNVARLDVLPFDALKRNLNDLPPVTSGGKAA